MNYSLEENPHSSEDTPADNSIEMQSVKMREMLGIGSNRSLGARCSECQQWAQKLNKLQIALDMKDQELENARESIQILQEQNRELVSQTKDAVNRLTQHIEQMEEELIVRDQMNDQLNKELEEDQRLIQEIHQEHERREMHYQEQWDKRELESSEYIEQLQQDFQQQLSAKQQQTTALRAKISQYLADKSTLQRKLRSQAREREIQKFEFQESIKSLEGIVEEKQKLIKYLSNANDEVRMQLIDMKAKQEVNDLTWVTQRKMCSYDSKGEDSEAENAKLRLMNARLQNQIKKVVDEAERMQSSYSSLKQQKQTLEKTLAQIKSNRSGKIQRQSTRETDQPDIPSCNKIVKQCPRGYKRDRRPNLQILIEELDAGDM